MTPAFCDAKCAPVLHVHTSELANRPAEATDLEKWRSTWRAATPMEVLLWKYTERALVGSRFRRFIKRAAA